MKIRITNLAWFLFVLLSILMGGSIGRSYMWLVAGSVVLFFMLYRGRRGILLNDLVKKYNLFLLYCVLITAFDLIVSRFEKNSYIKSQLIEMLILTFAASYLASYCSDEHSAINLIKKISWLLLAAGVLEAVTKFNATIFLGNERYVTQYLVKDGRIISIFSHPIGYAIVLTFFFLVALYFPYSKKNKQITYVGLILVNLLCTKTRMAMLAVAISAGIYFLKNKGLRRLFNGKLNVNRNSLIYIMIMTVLVIFCVGIFREKLSIFWNSIIYRLIQMVNGSEQGIRLGVIANYISDIGKNSISEFLFGKGTGYASFYMTDNPIYYWNDLGEKVAWAETTDNMYVTILMNYGVVGFALFMLVLIAAVKKIILEKNRNVLFGCSGIVAICFDLFFFEGLYWPVVMNIFGIYMAFVTKKGNEMIGD